MSVLTLAGKPINWAKPPKPTDLVQWSRKTTGGRMVKGSLRTIAHLDHMDSLSRKKFKRGISVIQSAYNTGVSKSKGTHDRDACLDVWIEGVPGDEQEKFFRANGGGAYHRTPEQGFSRHIHYFCLPPREGKSIDDDYKVAGFKVGYLVDGGYSTVGRKIASSQIGDYYRHDNALASHAPDRGWFPPNIAATIFDLPAYIARQRKAQGSLKPVAPSHAKAIIRVATNNIMSLPENSDYRSTLLATPGCSVLLVQEADTPRGKAAIKSLPGYTTHVIPVSDTYNAFVLYDESVWEHVSTKFVKQYSGKSGISKTRHIAVTVLRHKLLGREFAFISYHAVTAGGDKDRKRMRKEGLTAVRSVINGFRKLGVPVIVGGDYNQTGDIHPTSDLHTADGIIHQFAWNGKRVLMTRKSFRKVKTPSDHDALSVAYDVTTK